MAWNEPGGNRDPWGGSGGNNRDPWSRKGQREGPPDLDEVVRNLRERLSGLFGGRGGDGGDSGGSGGSGGGFSSASLPLGWILLVAVIVWMLSGIYIVDEGKRGVVLRFGEYHKTAMPGPHWRIPYPVDRVEVVNVDRQRVHEIGYRTVEQGQRSRAVPREALMLTRDENIIDVRLAVQYRIKDPHDFVFNVRVPDDTVKEAAESALREVVGRNDLEFILTEGRQEVMEHTEELLQVILDHYESGIHIITTNLQDAQPPEEVQEAFADAIRAREDEQRIINRAEAYANEVLPAARGRAARRVEEAEGYRARITDRAAGESQRFLDVLAEYQQAPTVYRERAYLDTMQSILSNTSKVMVDVSGASNLLYLPLDRLRDGHAPAAGAAAGERIRQPELDQIESLRDPRSRETR